MAEPIEHVITSGTFNLDGGSFNVDNNVWIIGDDREVLIIDAAHDATAIAAAVGDRRVKAVVCTHAHDDHINQAPALAEMFSAPILLHPAEKVLWEMTWPHHKPDKELRHDQVLSIGSIDLRVLHTPGHSPGSSCLYAPELKTVFTGDTLFRGGPGATGRSYSSFDLIIDSIRDTLLPLPGDTQVRTGHGDPTKISDESPPATPLDQPRPLTVGRARRRRCRRRTRG